MTTFALVLFILLIPLCLALVGLILLQGGAGDISSAFGGGGQLDSTLGVGAGRKMSKITGWMAGSFFVIVLLLSIQHAGDFGKAAGAAPAKLSTDPMVPPMLAPPPTPAPPTQVPTTIGAPPVPAAPSAPALITEPVPAPAAAPQPAPAVPVAPAATAPAAPAPAAGVPVQPVPAVPAQPQSGVKLDDAKPQQ